MRPLARRHIFPSPAMGEGNEPHGGEAGGGDPSGGITPIRNAGLRLGISSLYRRGGGIGVVALLVLLCLALPLLGCGKRAPLDPPPGEPDNYHRQYPNPTPSE